MEGAIKMNPRYLAETVFFIKALRTPTDLGWLCVELFCAAVLVVFLCRPVYMVMLLLEHLNAFNSSTCRTVQNWL